MPPRKQKLGSKEKLSCEEKKALALIISNHSSIWKLTDPGHRKRDVQAAAWVAVSEALGKPIPLCKDGWKSLKDGLSYHGGSKKKGKSGDSAENIFEDDVEDFDEHKMQSWEFWEDMKFLIDAKPQRMTHHGLNLTDGDDQHVESHLQSPSSDTSKSSSDLEIINLEKGPDTPDVSIEIDKVIKCSASSDSNKRKSVMIYDYPSKRPKKLIDKSSDDRIADSIQSLVELRKLAMSDSEPQNLDKMERAGLKYYSVYLNMDRMLQKLPENVVEDLQLQFQIQIRDELNKLNK